MRKFINYLLLSVVLLAFRLVFTLLVVTDSIHPEILASLWKVPTPGVEFFPLYSVVSSILTSFQTLLPIPVESLANAIFLGVALYLLDKILDMVYIFDDKRYYVYIALICFPVAFLFQLNSFLSLFTLLMAGSIYTLFKKKYLLASLILSLGMLTNFWAISFAIPLLVHFYVAEKYNEKIKVVPNALIYSAIIFTPILLINMARFSNLLVYLETEYKFTLVPFGYIYNYVQAVATGFSIYSTLYMALLIGLIVLTVKTFVKFFLVYEHRNLEQNTLFLHALIFTILLGAITAPVDLILLNSLCLSYFLLSAVVYNVYMKNKMTLGLLFVLLSLQALFFVQLLQGM